MDDEFEHEHLGLTIDFHCNACTPETMYYCLSFGFQKLTRSLFITLFFEEAKDAWHVGVKMLYESMFPASVLAISRILSHCGEECTKDS